jgi:hypothetical protein
MKADQVIQSREQKQDRENEDCPHNEKLHEPEPGDVTHEQSDRGLSEAKPQILSE